MSSPDEVEAPDETAAGFKGIVLSQTHIDLRPDQQDGATAQPSASLAITRRVVYSTRQIAILQALYQA